MSELLTGSFVFLDRVTCATERKIWASGVRDWHDFKAAKKVVGIGKKRKLFYDAKITELERHYQDKNYNLLLQYLPKSEYWRLFPLVADSALYLDIETAQRYGDITVLGAWDGTDYFSFVKGCNMDKELIRDLLSRYRVFITFNGGSFDVPIIERYFGKTIFPEDAIHLDLRYVCARLGLHGGLKAIETRLGLRRSAEIDGMCGAEAGLLWHEFLLTGDVEQVELLLEYNKADCVNLEPLAKYAVEALWTQMRIGASPLPSGREVVSLVATVDPVRDDPPTSLRDRFSTARP